MPKPSKSNSHSHPDSSGQRSALEIEAPKTKSKRKFGMAKRRRIVRAADACAHGELGALFLREGIYHTQLSEWRAKINATVRNSHFSFSKSQTLCNR